MSSKEGLGANVTKSTYIKSDGSHAVFAGGQSYMDVTGERIVETVSTATSVDFKKDNKGKTTYRSLYDGTWFRISDDNGLHWTDCEEKFCFDTGSDKEQLLPSGCTLDDKNNVLVRFLMGKKANKDCYGYVNQGTYRAFHSVSRDHGVTWSEPVQIVDMREGYDAVSWGPDFIYGKRGGIPHRCVWLDDGSVVVPYEVHERLDGSRPWYFWIICARGYWKKDMSGFDWVFGDRVEVTPERASAGCNEPTIVALGGDKLFMVTRCGGTTSEGAKEIVEAWTRAIEGGQRDVGIRALRATLDAGKGFYSSKYCALSEDAGMTWSTPEPLVYDDGTTVWTPASQAEFYESSKTGKTYLIANILNKPVHGQTPRYPLTIAEFDRNRRCIVRDSVQVIQDKPEGANEHVRYTNFGRYEDRKTKKLIITLAEQYRYKGWDEVEKPEDRAADCVKYEVEIA